MYFFSADTIFSKYIIKSLIENNINQINKMIDIAIKKNSKNDGYYFLGRKLNIIKSNVKRPYLDDDNLYINTNEDIEKWFNKMSKKVFKERLDIVYNNFTKIVPYPKIVIRKMKTRWGVCNKNLEKVTLNYNLIHMDRKYLDYVIVHELSHFIHFDHSKEFWKLVEENEPNYKQIRKEMRS